MQQLSIFPRDHPAYSIDTSSLIELAYEYPINEFPELWDKMRDYFETEHIYASTEVLSEVEPVDDDLHTWCKEIKNLFIRTDEPLQSTVSEITSEFRGFVDPDSSKNKADPFVIALAKLRNLIVITEEKEKPGVTNIPHICGAMEIGCINIENFLNRRGIVPNPP